MIICMHYKRDRLNVKVYSYTILVNINICKINGWFYVALRPPFLLIHLRIPRRNDCLTNRSQLKVNDKTRIKASSKKTGIGNKVIDLHC